MIIKDEACLDRFRGKRNCEVCRAQQRIFPHHWHARGMGGGSRIDHPNNLVAVCNACHQKIHDGKVSRSTVLEIIAKREGKTPTEVQQWLWDTLARAKEM